MDDECVEALGRPISSLKVTDLRDELAKRALTKTGNKKELIDRLRQALQKGSLNSAAADLTVKQTEPIEQETVITPSDAIQADTVTLTGNNQASNQEQSSETAPVNVSSEATEQSIAPENLVVNDLALKRNTDSLSDSAVDLASESINELTPNKLDDSVKEKSNELLLGSAEKHEIEQDASSTPFVDEVPSVVTEETPEPISTGSQHVTGQEKVVQDAKPDEISNQRETADNESSTQGSHNLSNKESVAPVTFTLKRRVSEPQDANSKDGKKRRKWSAKPDIKNDSEPALDPTSSGGISSQKLQKLIDAQPVEPSNQSKKETPAKSESKGDSKKASKRVEEANASVPLKKRLGEKVAPDGVNSEPLTIDREGDKAQSQELDDLFKKTKSKPPLFWLPLTEEQAEIRQKDRREREVREREVARKAPARRSSPPRRRSPQSRRTPPRHRSPRRSPIRHRSPISRRSPPPRRRSPVRNSPPAGRRSPDLGRRSPGLYRRSPISSRRSPNNSKRSSGPNRQRSPGFARRSPVPTRRSPAISRRSPAPIRRSPGLSRRSPGPIRRSPGPARRSPLRNSPDSTRRSPGPIRRSPGPIRRSPGPMRRSPGPLRRSPGPFRRSPVSSRRSPGPTRRSPGPIRRSPGPNRRSPGLSRRSPGPLRRSPGPTRRSPGPTRRSPGPGRRSPGPTRRSPIDDRRLIFNKLKYSR